MNNIKCVHQLDYWEDECSVCKGDKDCCKPFINRISPNKYQSAIRTANKSLFKKDQLQNGVMGLTEKAGACAGLLMDHLFQGYALDRAHFAKELGDIARYLAVCSDALGYDLEEIFKMNIDKLKARYPDRFDTDLSVHRKIDDI